MDYLKSGASGKLLVSNKLFLNIHLLRSHFDKVFTSFLLCLWLDLRCDYLIYALNESKSRIGLIGLQTPFRPAPED